MAITKEAYPPGNGIEIILPAQVIKTSEICKTRGWRDGKVCWVRFKSARREFLRQSLHKNIAIIAIQYDKFILLIPLAIFPILLGEIHSSPSGKIPYTY